MNKRLAQIICAVLCVCLVVAGVWLFSPKPNSEPVVTAIVDTGISSPKPNSEPVVTAIVDTGISSPKPNGEPVVIAIIDTGISSKAIPADHILEGKNYCDPALSTEDTYGHGTAVASVILKHFPQAQLVPLVSNVYVSGKIKQVTGDVFAQMIRDAIDVYHCDIINVSAGLILDKTPIREAVAYAEEQGVLVVASAGNDYAQNGDFAYFPASYDTVFAVGSVTKDGTSVSDFSQRGKWVDIYTCGEDVEIATLSGNTKQSEGTSYSAARITAEAAKLLQKNPDLTAAQLREKLLGSAQSLPDGRKYIP